MYVYFVLLMSQIGNAWPFYIVYGVVISIGISAATIPTLSTIARWFVKRRGLMSGIVQAGHGLGGMVLSPVAGWLILTSDWRNAYVVLGIVSLVFIMLSGPFMRREPARIGQLPYGTEQITISGEDSQRLNSPITEFSFREAIRTQQFWILSIMLFGFGFCRTSILVHIAAHVDDLGFSLATGATVLAIISGASMVSRVGMGQLADIIGNRQGFMVGFIVMATGFFWIQAVDKLWMLFLFAATFGFSWGTLAVIRMPMVAEVFGTGSLGAILGTLDFTSQLGAFIGPLLAGVLFDVTGEYTVTFFILAGVSSIGLILTVFLKSIQKLE